MSLYNTVEEFRFLVIINAVDMLNFYEEFYNDQLMQSLEECHTVMNDVIASWETPKYGMADSIAIMRDVASKCNAKIEALDATMKPIIQGLIWIAVKHVIAGDARFTSVVSYAESETTSIQYPCDSVRADIKERIEDLFDTELELCLQRAVAYILK